MDTERDAPPPPERPPPAEEPAKEPPAEEPAQEPPPAEEPPPPAEEPPPPAEEPPPPAEEPPPSEQRLRAQPPRKRRWSRALAVVLGVLLCAVIAVLAIAPGYLRGRVVEEARERGVILSFGDADWGSSTIVLHDAKLSLLGVRDFDASAAAIEVDLDDWQPRLVRAKRLVVSMFGTEVVSALDLWNAAHPAALAVPFAGESARIDWHPARGTDAALSLDGALALVHSKTGVVDATSARLGGRAAGPMKVDWVIGPQGYTVQILPGAPPLSALRAEVRSAEGGPRIKLILAKTALTPLQTALGIPKGSEGLVAEGEGEMAVPSLARPAPVEGSIRLSVKGYVPPHPRELDGILFGDATAVRAKVTLAADLASAKLSQVAVEAGALALSGSGDVVRDGGDARVTLKLKGSIPCTALATSAAVAHLGSDWGGLAGGLAGGVLKGNVAVALTIDAKASDLGSADIAHSARLNCKVAIPGLPTIEIR